MDKKYQVFISSTYEDLKEERSEAARTILQLDCIPSGMEMFCSNSEEQFNIIKQIIDLCDYYILIVANRYGSIHKKEKKSFTELEYEYACYKEIPILVFIADKDCDKPFDNHEDLLNSFKQRVSENRLVSYWKNKDELAKQIAISLSNSFKKNDRPGWIKSNENETEMIRLKEVEKEFAKTKEKLKQAEKEIDNLTSFNEALNFDQEPILISYKDFRGNGHTKSIYFKDIFRDVSIHLINVSIVESGLTDLIAKAIDKTNYSYIDKTILKKICNQFLALGLFYTQWDNEKRGLYYGLTKNGVKLRDEYNLYIVKKDRK